jgi:divalent metal cation (Fe/Co/Zn/Cd) transporter
MSGAAGLDVRVPIGGLFTVLGLMLSGYGLVVGSGSASLSAGSSTNVNLWWGLVMLVFGLLLLLGSFLARRRVEVHRRG